MSQKERSQIESTYGLDGKAVAGGNDPGEIRFVIGVRADGMICVEFDRPCKFFALDVESAAKFGVVMIDHARTARALKGDRIMLPRVG